MDPKQIMRNLKSNGVTPKDVNGVVLDPSGWERVLYFHMKQCLNIDCDLYRRKVKLAEDNQDLSIDIKSRLNELIANQFKIILQEQEKIMSGKISPNFLEQVESLKLLLSAI